MPGVQGSAFDIGQRPSRRQFSRGARPVKPVGRDVDQTFDGTAGRSMSSSISPQQLQALGRTPLLQISANPTIGGEPSPVPLVSRSPSATLQSPRAAPESKEDVPPLCSSPLFVRSGLGKKSNLVVGEQVFSPLLAAYAHAMLPTCLPRWQAKDSQCLFSLRTANIRNSLTSSGIESNDRGL